MESWPGPRVPRLPGRGRPLRLHDTATGEVRPTAPGATARMYVCGITPYDATHLGPRGDVPRLRPRAAGLAGRRPRRALRAERHRRRRPAAGAGRARRRGLAGARRSRDRAVPRRHDRAAGAAAGPTTSARSRRSREIVAGDPAAARPGRRLPRRRRRLLLRSAPRRGSATSRGSTWRPCWRCRPSAAATRTAPGKQDPLDPLLWRAGAAGRAVLGLRARARPARAGTSSARRSR